MDDDIIPPHVLGMAEDYNEAVIRKVLQDGANTNWQDEYVVAFAKAIMEAREELEDKLDVVKADLDEAIYVAYNRGAEEWVRVKYPFHYARFKGKTNGNQ